MTPKQKRVFNFIRSTFIEGGISPTYTEIMEALNIKSKSVVAHYLNALEKEGKIKINRVKARGIEIEDDENTKLKDLLKECYFINEMVIHTFNWLETIVTPSQKYICPKVVGGINKTQQRINQILGEDE